MPALTPLKLSLTLCAEIVPKPASKKIRQVMLQALDIIDSFLIDWCRILVQSEDVALARSADAIEQLSIAGGLIQRIGSTCSSLAGVRAVPWLNGRITMSLRTVWFA